MSQHETIETTPDTATTAAQPPPSATGTWSPRNMTFNIGATGKSVVQSVRQKVSSILPNQLITSGGGSGSGDAEIVYEKMTAKHAAEVLALLLNYFIADEPTNNAVQLTQEDALKAFMDWIHSGVKDQISFVALDSKLHKVIACRLNSIEHENKPHHEDSNQYPERMRLVWNYVAALGHNVFTVLPSNPSANPRKLLKLEIVCVDPAYRRRGVAQRLLEMTLALASRDHFDYIYATATSHKTQQLFQKLAFQSIRTISYQHYQDPASGQKPFQRNMDPQDISGQLMVKKV